MASTSTRCGGYFRDPFLKAGVEGTQSGAAGHGARNGEGTFGARTPTPIPVHPLFPGDSHSASQGLQLPASTMGCRAHHTGRRRGPDEGKGAWAFQSVKCRQASGVCLPDRLAGRSHALLGHQAQTGPGMGTGCCHLGRTDRCGPPGWSLWLGGHFLTPRGLVLQTRVAGGPSQCLSPSSVPAASAPRAAVPQSFLEPLQAVDGERAVPPGLQEALHVGQEDVAGGEEAGAQPEQLPAPLLAVPAGGGVVSSRAHPGV